jgi:hypothetical protein
MSHSSETIAEGGHHGPLYRSARTLWLDPHVFDEIEHDPHALVQATWIVVGAGVARGLLGIATETTPGIVGSLAGAIVLWLVATGLLATVGVRWLHGTSDFREMLRTLGFAALPLWFLAPVSLLSGPPLVAASVLVHVWAIGAAVIAVRQALDVGTGRALATCALALLVALGLVLLLGVPH